MKNTEIFNDYDMVVSVSERIINSEMLHLTKMGVIHPEFVLVQAVEKHQYVYKVLDSADDIPRDNTGAPTCAYIDGQITPEITIDESGSNVTFVLYFRGGTACFWEGSGPLASLNTYDMTGWKYGITILLDLKQIEKDDIGKKIKVPDLVDQQLNHFMDSMFSINHLFMDFESTDLLRFDPAHCDTKEAGDVGLEQLVTFMQFYLKNLVASGNPFILGYALTTDDATRYPENANVPDSLKPVGTTYSMYHDPNDQNLSNVNFVLATKGGHAAIAGTPGNFDSNWLVAAEQCDAKLIYSHTCLIEKFFLEPFFTTLQDNVFSGDPTDPSKKGISGNIDVNKGLTYAAGKEATDKGFKFTISNQGTGDDQYTNSYTVDITNDQDAATTTLAFTGTIHLYKEQTKNVGFDTAKASATADVPWSGQIVLVTQKDKDGNPELATTKSFTVGQIQQSTYENKAAEAFQWIGKLLGSVLDALTGFMDGGFFGNLLADVFSVSVPGLGDVSVAIGNLGNSVSTVLMLPAGQVFYFRNPATDLEGNLAMLLTYKSENAAPAPALAARVHA
jgi:hypothetical protein